jgi:hypothetical protein
LVVVVADGVDSVDGDSVEANVGVALCICVNESAPNAVIAVVAVNADVVAEIAVVFVDVVRAVEAAVVVVAEVDVVNAVEDSVLGNAVNAAPAATGTTADVDPFIAARTAIIAVVDVFDEGNEDGSFIAIGCNLVEGFGNVDVVCVTTVDSLYCVVGNNLLFIANAAVDVAASNAAAIVSAEVEDFDDGAIDVVVVVVAAAADDAAAVFDDRFVVVNLSLISNVEEDTSVMLGDRLNAEVN